MEGLRGTKISASAESAEEVVERKTNKMTQWLFRNSKENFELGVLYPGGLKNCIFGSWVDTSWSFQKGALFMDSMEPGEWSGQKLYCYKSILKFAYIYPVLFAGPAFWWIES